MTASIPLAEVDPPRLHSAAAAAALAPTRDELIASAHQLYDRMIDAVDHEGVPA